MSPGEAHQILELTPPFTREEVEVAYQAALAFWHPSHFAEDEERLNEAMDRNISINEAYRLLTAAPEARPTASRLSLPAAPLLAEPTVEQVPPRILGPRLRIPKAPPTTVYLPPSTSSTSRGSASGHGPSSPRSNAGMTGAAVPVTRPPPPPPRVIPQNGNPPPVVPWIIGIGGVMSVMLIWSFTQAGIKSRANHSAGSPSAASASPFNSSSQIAVPARPTRLTPVLETLYEQATVKNDPVAQRELGDSFKYSARYQHHERAESTSWYRKAALQGDPVAQRQLGHAYREGLGVPVDLSEALSWYRKAASGGDSDAREALDAMER